MKKNQLIKPSLDSLPEGPVHIVFAYLSNHQLHPFQMVLPLRLTSRKIRTMVLNYFPAVIELFELSPEYLEKLSQLFKNLVSLSSSRLRATSNSSWKGFESFHNIRSLAIHDGVGDAQLECFCKLRVLQNSLKTLNISFNKSFSPKLLAGLSSLESLTSLNLSCCESISDSHIENLISLKGNLRELFIRSSLISDSSLKFISENFFHLWKLDLGNCEKITEKGVEDLKKLSSLLYLDLCNCQHVNLSNQLLPFSENLTHLDLSSANEEVNSKNLPFLSCLSRLEFLGIAQWNSLTDSLLGNVPTCLRKLHLYQCLNLTDLALSDLRILSSLTHLDLTGCQSVTSLQPLSQLPHLERLIAHGCTALHFPRNDEEGISSKSSTFASSSSSSSSSLLPLSLQSLKLTRARNLTDANSKWISFLSNLTFLNLSKCFRISNETVSTISHSLPKLVELDLSNCNRITDLHLITKLANLKVLKISECGSLTDESVSSIPKMTSLAEVDISDCDFSDACLEALCSALPHTEISLESRSNENKFGPDRQTL